MNVTIGFSTTNKFMSKVIRWITGAVCSHAWIAFDDETLGTRIVLQAETWGYEVRPWRRWLHENKLVAEFRPSLALDNVRVAVQYMATKLGSKYDFKSALLVGIIAWVRRWVKGRMSVRPSRSPHKLMCSESVIIFLNKAGFTVAQTLPEEETSPGRLLSAIRESYEFEEITKARN